MCPGNGSCPRGSVSENTGVLKPKQQTAAGQDTQPTEVGDEVLPNLVLTGFMATGKTSVGREAPGTTFRRHGCGDRGASWPADSKDIRRGW